jgi:carboxyl-terminal processing protease
MMNGKDEYYNDLTSRLESGELVNGENTYHFPDSLKYQTLRNKRDVYGGGGIMPDFFIPLDTSSVSDYYSQLLRSGALNTFSIEYTNENRAQLLQKYPDIRTFDQKFVVDQSILDALYAHSDGQGIERKASDETLNDEFMNIQLKALVARSLWDFGAFIQIRMQQDEAYMRAIEIIEEDTFEKLKIHWK